MHTNSCLQTTTSMLSSRTAPSTAGVVRSRAAGAPLARRPIVAAPRSNVACDAAAMQFFRGVNESNVPDVQLMRSRTGTSGSARIIFDNPSLFQASSEMGEITGLYLVDDEGELQTTDVKAKFVNGKPSSIEARMNFRTQFEWERFIRFMDRYAEANGLGFEGPAKK